MRIRSIFLFGFPFIVFSFFLNLSYLGNNKIYLKVPRASEVDLPTPIFFPNLIFNVLGAQAINPTDIIHFVNSERNKRGEKNLIINEKLTKAAKTRAEIILKHQNFSHQDPFENIELTTVLPAVSYFYSYASENIGMGGVSAEDFVAGFMNSKSHRENLLNPDLYHSGAWVVTGPFKQYYVNIAVQLFAIPSSRDEYLGYNADDKKKYRRSLTRLNIELNPIILTAEKIFKKDYRGQKINNLKKQKEILVDLLKTMEKDSPFEENQISLIKEYNGYF